MEARFAGWRDDLPRQSGWAAFLEDCPPPAFDRIPLQNEIAEDSPVWPGRQNARHADAPQGSHVCRPFERIEPFNVRVVVLGQDPYPAIESATGRAFEDGTPDTARKALRPALRILGQSALDIQGEAIPSGFCHGREGRADAIRGCFNRLAEQGVLCLNASWTYTNESHLRAHRNLWKPVTAYIIRQLAQRPDGHPIFLLLGGETQALFDHLNLDGVPTEAAIRNLHPTERENRYFAGPNPLACVNDAVDRTQNPEPITWWSIPDEQRQD
ncbi:MAG: uracil-DNA glycosylase family protein [Pseudomonadota bacterium]|nr:uracil-DNA glycosylase family protein [Pseudomonadota bacterium]